MNQTLSWTGSFPFQSTSFTFTAPLHPTIRSSFFNSNESAFTLTTFFPYRTSVGRCTMIASAWVFFFFSFFFFDETTNNERHDVFARQVLATPARGLGDMIVYSLAISQDDRRYFLVCLIGFPLVATVYLSIYLVWQNEITTAIRTRDFCPNAAR